MPNWCETAYVVTTENDDDENAKKMLKKFSDEIADPDVVGAMWLVDLWAHNNAEPVDGFSVRSHLLEADADDNANMVCVWTDDAWEPCAGSLMHLLQRFYPGLCVYYKGEEPGCGLYETNDENGTYFPEKYVVDSEDDSEYFCTDQELIDFVNRLPETKTIVETAEEALKKLREDEDFWRVQEICRVGLWDYLL